MPKIARVQRVNGEEPQILNFPTYNQFHTQGNYYRGYKTTRTGTEAHYAHLREANRPKKELRKRKVLHKFLLQDCFYM